MFQHSNIPIFLCSSIPTFFRILIRQIAHLFQFSFIRKILHSIISTFIYLFVHLFLKIDVGLFVLLNFHIYLHTNNPTAKKQIKNRVFHYFLRGGRGLPTKWQGFAASNLHTFRKRPFNFAPLISK
jgi:hypothetical protein